MIGDNTDVRVRPPTAAELVASIVYFDRYLAFDGDVIAFWKTLSPAAQDHAEYLVRIVVTTLEQPDAPRCPKGCDVATRPEAVASAQWLCTACGTEFAWPAAEDARVTSSVTPAITGATPPGR